MARGRELRRIGAALALAALAGCDALPPAVPAATPAPRARPAPPAPPPAPAPAQPSQASRELAAYYQRLQDDLLAQGLLRADGGGADTPYDADMLMRNFEQIALYDEYRETGTGFVAAATESRLRRWEKPVRMALSFGPLVPEAQRRADTAFTAAYLARLARVSGLDIAMAGPGERPNFHVYMVTEDGRPGILPQVQRAVPGIAPSALRTIAEMPRATLCLVFAFSDRTSPYSYDKAAAVIRAEHPDRLRQSCLHEEIAQGLGLANDSPRARPSIFNDDEEFGLLTTHDEMLLKMLYDPRLRTGMDAATARPLLSRIARELTGGPV